MLDEWIMRGCYAVIILLLMGFTFWAVWLNGTI